MDVMLTLHVATLKQQKVHAFCTQAKRMHTIYSIRTLNDDGSRRHGATMVTTVAGAAVVVTVAANSIACKSIGIRMSSVSQHDGRFNDFVCVFIHFFFIPQNKNRLNSLALFCGVLFFYCYY